IREKNLVSEEILAKTQAILYDVPFINLEKAKIAPDILKIIPEKISKTYEVIAFHTGDNNRLKVAMTNPGDFQALEFLEKKTGYSIEPYMALKNHILMIQDQYRGLTSEVSKALADAQQDDTIAISTEGDKNSSLDDEEDVMGAPVARVVNTILEYSIKSKSSDIHIEPMETKTRIRYRIDGVMQEALTLPKQIHPAVVSRIKIMSRLKIDEKRVPQDGRFRVTVHGSDYDLRVSTLPTIFGEKIVMRILDRSTSAPTLKQLGYCGNAMATLEKCMKMPHGMILTTGPTGSGKSTSLFAILTQVNTGEVNTITLEDPVEYWIEGINQVQINIKAGLTFAAGLRSILRQDPDIVMVGEIRDEETAEMAIHAALTGHLVVSTLHTNSAAGAIPRFLDMGVEPFLLASSLRAVIGQRLGRRICPECMETFIPPKEVQDQIKADLPELFEPTNPYRQSIIDAYPKIQKETLEGQIILSRGVGCEACGQTGYRGRVGIYEVMEMTESIAELTVKNSSAYEIQELAKKETGMLTLKQDGLLKALEGRTSYEESLRVAQD
ncbi:MAG TPA: type II/IV secretion system protein, partial [Candidatus Wirthbacteria bacterium]|nr:type II/IV secretion system protein [Candidatus Wirthbacteria bacterium]